MEFNETFGNISNAELHTALNITPHALYKFVKENNIPYSLDGPRKRIMNSRSTRKLLEKRGFKYPKLNISFQIVKGGAGKTTMSFSFACRAHQYGARVLVIDFDKQGNLSRSFGITEPGLPAWVNILRDKMSVEDLIVPLCDGFSFIPSTINNCLLDGEFTVQSLNIRDHIINELASIRDQYDIVVFDCPPDLNKITTAITCASDVIIMPVNPDAYATDGFKLTYDEVETMKSRFKIKPEVFVLWNRYDAREKNSMHWLTELAKGKDVNVLSSIIRVDADLKNAIDAGQNIFTFSKRSNARDDIDNFTRNILGLDKMARK